MTTDDQHDHRNDNMIFVIVIIVTIAIIVTIVIFSKSEMAERDETGLMGWALLGILQISQI